MLRWKQYLLEKEIDICCVTESRLDSARDKIFEEMFGDVYNCFIRSRTHMKRLDPGSGGVAILVKKGIGKATLTKIGKCQDLVWVEVEGEDMTLYVASAYMVHAGSNWQANNLVLRNELEEDMMTYKNQGLVVVMGDFNGRISETISTGYMTHRKLRKNCDKEQNANGRELIALMGDCDMTITTGLFGVAKYTCWRDRGNSVIDHICIDTKYEWRIVNLCTEDEVMNRINTDHSMVVADMVWRKCLQVRKGDPKREKVGRKPKLLALNRISNKDVWREFEVTCDNSEELLDLFDPQEMAEIGGNICSRMTIEDKWSEVKDIVRKMETWARAIVNEKGLLQFKFIGSRIKSDQKITQLMIDKQWALKMVKRTKYIEEKKLLIRVFKNSKNKLNKARKKLKRMHKEQVIGEIEGLQKSHPGIFWRKLKELSGSRKRKKGTPDIVLDEHHQEVSGEAAVLAWKKAFASLGKEAESKESFDDQHADRTSLEVQEIEVKNTGRGDPVLNHQIQFEEVKEVIQSLKNGKASGIDDIVSEIIKYGGKRVFNIIWILCRDCFELECIPEDWMKGVIFPIYKDGDARDPGNYRGISLLSIVGKVYSSVINKRLTTWSEKNGIVLEEQGGFRPGRGCVDQIYVLTSLLKSRRGKKTFCCFIDLSKAYDRVWRTGLWKRLWDEGIRGKLWRVLKNMYSDTQNCVLAGTARSEFFSVDIGVRQGCVLSPLLFSIYINELIREINRTGIGLGIDGKNLGILLYADDIVLMADTWQELHTLLDITTRWGSRWRATFNQRKSQVVVFGERKHQEYEWKLGGKTIEQVNNYK